MSTQDNNANNKKPRSSGLKPQYAGISFSEVTGGRGEKFAVDLMHEHAQVVLTGKVELNKEDVVFGKKIHTPKSVWVAPNGAVIFKNDVYKLTY